MRRVPAAGSSGLLTASSSSTCALGIILDHELQRAQHRHAPRRRPVQLLADGMLEHGDVDDAVGAWRRRCGATNSRIAAGGTPRRRKPGQRRHARIVPAADMAAAHQLGQHALRQHRVAEIEPRELVLARPRRHRQVVEEPVVERPVVLEFERADRMGDALDGVRLAVREIVGRIDAPRRAGARMRGVQDAVEHRVAQVDVAGRHVDLGAQHARAVGELAGAHAAEQVEILRDAAVAIGAVAARLGQGAAQCAASPRRVWSST